MQMLLYCILDCYIIKIDGLYGTDSHTDITSYKRVTCYTKQIDVLC
jgi:hypothetical protein